MKVTRSFFMAVTVLILSVAAVFGGNAVSSAAFAVGTKDIDAAVAVDNVPDKEFTGGAIEPVLTVTDGATPLTEGTDYSVEFSDNTFVGTAHALLTGMGDYSGTKEITFEIIPSSEETSYSVKHWLQNLSDDDYTEQTDDEETLNGYPGNNTVAVAGAYTGFAAKAVEQQVIYASGTTVNVYYDRIQLTITASVDSECVGYGTVSPSQMTVRYGTALTAEGSVLHFGSQNLLATKTAKTAQYTYAFDSWVTGGVTEVTEDIAVTAKFTRSICRYTVLFKDYDGSSLGSAVVDYNTDATYPNAAPTRTQTDGYTYLFSAWYTEKDGGTEDDLTAVVANRTVYARYTETPREYAIVFYENGGAEIADGVYTYGAGHTVTETTTRSGYGFLYWTATDDKEDTTAVTLIGTEAYGDKTLYAKWEALSVGYTVKHYFQNLADDAYTEDTSVGESATALTDSTASRTPLTRTGFTYDGTQGCAEATVKGDGTTALSFYYTRNVYTVTVCAKTTGYGTVDGKDTFDLLLKFGTAFSFDGDTFSVGESDYTAVIETSDAQFTYSYQDEKYWNYIPEGGETVAIAAAYDGTVASNATVMAMFIRTINRYTVTFRNYTGEVLATATVDYGEDAAYPKAEPTRAKDNGYTYAFDGWYTEQPNALTPNGTKDDLTDVTADRTVYLFFAPTARQYEIIFHVEDGTPVTGSYQYTYAAERPLTETSSKTGYTFGGWSLTDGGAKIDTVPAETYGTLTVYAIFTADTFAVTLQNTFPTAGITLETNAATYTKEVTATYDESMPTVTVPYAHGFTFLGYFTQAEGGICYYDGEGNSMLLWQLTPDPKEYTLYAHWSDKIEYTIAYNNTKTFDGVAPTSFYVDTATFDLPVLDDENGMLTAGYSFGGWYTDDLTFINRVDAIEQGTYANYVLYAKWTYTQYTLTYVCGEGLTPVNGNPTLYTAASEDITLTDPTLTGYDFLGWYTESGYENKVAKEGEIDAPTVTSGSYGNKTFYARWQLTEIVLTVANKTYTYNTGKKELSVLAEQNAEGVTLSYEWKRHDGTDYVVLPDVTVSKYVFDSKQHAQSYLFRVTVTASVGGYATSKTGDFSVTVLKKSINEEKMYVVGADEARSYIGADILQEIEVADNLTELTENTDFTVAYENNYHAGTATVTVAGIGEYEGEREIEFVIAKAQLTYTFTDASVMYDRTDKALEYELTGLQGADTVQSQNIYYRKDGKITVPHGVGDYQVTVDSVVLGHGDAADYQFSFLNGKLTIRPVTLLVSANNTEQIYDGTAHAAAPSVSGLLSGDTLDIVFSYEGERVHSGSYAITVKDGDYNFSSESGESVTNYALTEAIQSFNESKKSLTVAPARIVFATQKTTEEYNGKAHTVLPTATVDDEVRVANEENVIFLYGTDRVAILCEYSLDGETWTDAVGVGSWASRTSLDRWISGQSGDYTLAFNTVVENAVVITKCGINISWNTDRAVHYNDENGRFEFVYSGLSARFEGSVLYDKPAGDDVIEVTLAYSIDGENWTEGGVTHAGGYYVKVNKVTGSENYAFVTPEERAILWIEPATVSFTINAPASTPVYNAEAHTVTATPNGLYDDDECEYVLHYSDNINAGVCTVTVASGTVTSGYESNYKFDLTATSEFTVEKATVSVTVISTEEHPSTVTFDRQYHSAATTAAPLYGGDTYLCTAEYSCDGIHWDESTVKEAGTYTVKISAASVIGEHTDNYFFVLGEIGTFVIEKRTVHVEIGEKTVVYDGSRQKAELLYDYGITEEQITTDLLNVMQYECTDSEVQSRIPIAAGVWKVSVNPKAPTVLTDNFILVYDGIEGTLTIEKADFDFSATECKAEQASEYNGEAQFPVLTDLPAEIKCIYLIEGGEAFLGFTDVHDGIDVTVMFEPSTKNYNDTLQSYTVLFSVIPRKVTAEWGGNKVTYNGTDSLPTATYEDVDGEIQSLEIALSGSYPNYPAVGYKYNATATATDGNYEVFVNKTYDFSVTKRKVKITFSGHNGLKYNGKQQKISAEVEKSELVEGDAAPELAIDYGANVTVCDAGSYSATVTMVGENPYYELDENYTKLSFNIAPKQVVITPADTQSVYGEDLPSTVKYEIEEGYQFCGKDKLTSVRFGVIMEDGTFNADVKTLPVLTESDARSYYDLGAEAQASANYTVSVQPAKLVITARPITVFVKDQKQTDYTSTELKQTEGTAWEVVSGSVVGSDNLGITLTTYVDISDPTETYGIIRGKCNNTNYAVTFTGEHEKGKYGYFWVAKELSTLSLRNLDSFVSTEEYTYTYSKVYDGEKTYIYAYFETGEGTIGYYSNGIACDNYFIEEGTYEIEIVGVAKSQYYSPHKLTVTVTVYPKETQTELSDMTVSVGTNSASGVAISEVKEDATKCAEANNSIDTSAGSIKNFYSIALYSDGSRVSVDVPISVNLQGKYKDGQTVRVCLCVTDKKGNVSYEVKDYTVQDGCIVLSEEDTVGLEGFGIIEEDNGTALIWIVVGVVACLFVLGLITVPILARKRN